MTRTGGRHPGTQALLVYNDTAGQTLPRATTERVNSNSRTVRTCSGTATATPTTKRFIASDYDRREHDRTPEGGV